MKMKMIMKERNKNKVCERNAYTLCVLGDLRVEEGGISTIVFSFLFKTLD